MAKKSHAYSLGVYLAEYIMHAHMPSLSCYQWTNKAIQVTSEEADETKRLSDVWFEKLSEEKYKLIKDFKGSNVERYNKEKEAQALAKKEWNEDMKYRYMLTEKYLPHTLECIVPYVDFSDEEVNKEIMKGFIGSMWDSDHCEYSLKEEDITFENEHDSFGPENKHKIVLTHVTMKLSLEAPSSYTGDDWIEIKTPQKTD